MSQEAILTPLKLSKYPTASFRELFFLSLPLILGLFSTSFMGFCDRLFLARYSLAALEGSVTAGNLSTLFQHPLIRIVMMSQVFVGLYAGSNSHEKIGPTTWQMIWLSLFSMLITVPLSFFVAPYFFAGTSVQPEATTYFSAMMLINFLFPLGIALSSYFIGQGRMTIIFITTLFSHGLNILLDYLFIFGVGDILPSMGILGAAIATGCSQFLFCIILMAAFLKKKDREIFNTGKYYFDKKNFWSQLKVGLPRAMGRVIILTAWVSISRLMTLKGGDYLMVLSVGGTLILLFSFINDGMLQGMITIASNLMGAKDYSKIWKLIRSGFLLLSLTTLLLVLPYLVFPHFTLSFFFVTPPSETTLLILQKMCPWLWLFFFCYGFHAIGLSLITASRDMGFYLSSIVFVWLTSFIPVYIVMEVFNGTPDKLWLVMALDSFIFGIFFFIRVSKEKWKTLDNYLDLEINT